VLVNKQLQVDDFFECIGYHAITRVICTVHEWNECTADTRIALVSICTRESRRATFTTQVLMCGFNCDLSGPDCVARVRLLINAICVGVRVL